MNLSKKSLSAVLAATLAMTMIAGCTSNTPADNKPKEQTEPSPYYIVDGKETVVPFVMKIDGNIISIEEYRSYFLSTKAQFEAMTGGSDLIWTSNPELQSMITETAEQQIMETYAIKRMAKDIKLELTDADKKEVDEIIAKVKTDFGTDEAYQQALLDSYLTEAIYRDSVETDKLASNIYEYYFGEKGTKVMSDEDVLKKVNESYVHVKHVLIEKDAEGETTKKDLATEVAAKAKAGEDFDALIKEYGTDPGMEASPDGYYFTFGEMVKPFEDASFAMKVDEVSDIVESDFGYHIIKKYPIQEEYVKTNKAQFTEAAYQEIISGILDEAVKALEVEKWEKYDTLTIETMPGNKVNN